MLPWHRRSEKLRILFRMCQRTNKIVFGAICGMHMLIYLHSCTHPIRRVINGNGNGGSLQDARTFQPSDLSRLTFEDVLLDNTTGDVYQYDYKRQEFVPVANVGIHYRRAAQDNLITRASILKANTHVVNTVDSPYPLFTGKQNEAKCRVLKPCNQHWLVQGLGLSPFLVPQTNAWDMHPVNNTQENSHVYVLAESERGPEIVVWGEHNVGVQFQIDPKYKETVVVLNNFVNHIVSLFEQEEKRIDLPIAVAESARKPMAILQIREKELKLSSRLEGFSHQAESGPLTGSTRPQTAKSRFSTCRPTTASTTGFGAFLSDQSTAGFGLRPNSAVAARHSGFAFSKRFHEPLIVPNNATTGQSIPAQSAISLSTPNFKADAPATFRLHHRIGTSTVFASPKSEGKLAVEIPGEATYSEKASLQTYEYKSMEATEADPNVWKRQREIRAMLHPGYPIDSMPTSGPRIAKVRSESTVREKKTIRLKVNRVSFTSRVSESVNPFAKTKTTLYPNLGLTVANDGSVYKDPEQRRREEEREARKRWISNKDFDITVNRKPDTATARRNVHLSPSEPVSSHAFRSESREKWLAGQFRIGSY